VLVGWLLAHISFRAERTTGANPATFLALIEFGVSACEYVVPPVAISAEIDAVMLEAVPPRPVPSKLSICATNRKERCRCITGVAGCGRFNSRRP
jgi:hypothetical protein